MPLLLILFTLPASAFAKKFTIRGEIEGLVKGDTLRFEHVELPKWQLTKAFETVVTEPDRFEHTGTQEHPEYYRVFSPVLDEYLARRHDHLPRLPRNVP